MHFPFPDELSIISSNLEQAGWSIGLLLLLLLSVVNTSGRVFSECMSLFQLHFNPSTQHVSGLTGPFSFGGDGCIITLSRT